jgi:hypothetical protein
MKRALIAIGILMGSMTLTATESSAFVCARGVYRAGCVGANGGVVVRRGYYPRAAVVVPRGRVVGRGVYYRRY